MIALMLEACNTLYWVMKSANDANFNNNLRESSYSYTKRKIFENTGRKKINKTRNDHNYFLFLFFKPVSLQGCEGACILLIDPTIFLHERVGQGLWWVVINAVLPHICITQISHYLPQTAVAVKTRTKAYHEDLVTLFKPFLCFHVPKNIPKATR